MKAITKITLLTAVALAAVTTVAAGDAATKPMAKPAAESHGAEGAMGMDPAMMEKWTAAMTPGPQHKMLERMVGTWTAKTKMWMDPSAPAMESTGLSVFTMALGGRYLIHNFKGSMMGQPFEGMGIDGYDNVRKQYTSLWMDSMSTAAMMQTGTCDEKGASCVYHGSMDDVMTGEMNKLFRSRMQWTGPNSCVFEMFNMDPGKDWVRMMEINYTRSK